MPQTLTQNYFRKRNRQLNRLLVSLHFFGLKLGRCENKYINAVFNFICGLAIFLMHFQTIHWAASVWLNHDFFLSTISMTIDGFKFLIIKFVILFTVDYFWFYRKQVSDCIYFVVDSYRTLVTESEFQKTLNKACKYCFIFLTFFVGWHYIIGGLFMGLVVPRDIKMQIFKNAFGLQNSTETAVGVVEAYFYFDCFVFDTLCGAELAASRVIVLAFHILKVSIDVLISNFISDSNKNSSIKLNLESMSRDIKMESRDIELKSRDKDMESRDAKLIKNYRILEKVRSRLEDTFGFVILVWFAKLFVVVNCDIYLAAVANKFDISWMTVMRIVLSWLPVLGVFWFGAEIERSGKKLKLALRNALNQDSDDKVSALIEKDFAITVFDIASLDRSFLFSFCFSVASFAIMFIQLV